MAHRLLRSCLLILLATCSNITSAEPAAATSETVIYVAGELLTMENESAGYNAVAVTDGMITGVGTEADLVATHPQATVDRTFAKHTVTPGLIDPHMHVLLGSMLYAHPLAPPWAMAVPGGELAGYGNREVFLDRLREIVASAPDDDSNIVVYGYHNLVHGDLDRRVLDDISPSRGLLVWHYSAHDFYLNSAALEQGGATPAMAETFHGVDVMADGTLSGRIYEDAMPWIMQHFGGDILAPAALARGAAQYRAVIRQGGITTTADLAWGAFDLALENQFITGLWQGRELPFSLHLVPEKRAFQRAFGERAPSVIAAMAKGEQAAPAPVLPRVKFFTDGAFYSQTMRLTAPGYLAGQSHGTQGLWVTEPDALVPAFMPYVEAGLAVHIHSNGDAAQTATLDALAVLRERGITNDFVVEHGGLFSPTHIERAAALDMMVSAASHYAHHMSGEYAAPLGEPRASWITPVGALREAGVNIALHSDAPLAPPQPLKAASVQMTRINREGAVYEATQALTPRDALAAITINAARVMGLQDRIGSIAVGKQADFTVLTANPLDTEPSLWPAIGIWGVVHQGTKHPLD